MKLRQLLLLAAAVGTSVAACLPQQSASVPVTPVSPTTPPATSTPPPTVVTPTPPPTIVAPSPTVAASPTLAPAARLADLVSRANRAYGQGQVQAARTLYRQALAAATNAPARDQQRLVAFARFRLGLAELVARDEEAARRILQEDFRTETDESFRRLAFQLWDAYAMSADLAAACATVSHLAEARAVRVDIGADQVIEAPELCVLPPAQS